MRTVGRVVKNIPEALKGPRLNYPPFFRKFKKEYGDIPIKSIRVCKNPIQETFDTILNLVSTGQFQKEKDKLNYDNMFHLFLVLELVDGRLVRLEKNQVLNIGFIEPSFIRKSCINVPLNAGDVLTINKLLDRAQDAIGNEFFLYDGQNNNCQIFIDNVLTYSDINSKKIKKFVLQDTEKIIGNLPSISRAIIKGATDLGAVFDVLLYGKGFHKILYR